MNQQTQVLAPGADHNPLLEKWGDPFGVPAFDRIEPDHFRGAFAHAFASHAAEVAAISSNAAAPTFENTIAALETSGQALTRTLNAFILLAGTHSNDDLLAIEREVA
ncbi:MAG TPA: peptidase M3, partial [Xanthobacteraceae bacterium]|nr:peptidase M3 [Xanthobacteraceae bacterium]